MRILLRTALVLVGFHAIPCEAQTPLDRARRDEIVFMSDDDPHMAAAMRKARSSLPEFLATARNPQSSMSHFSVKVGIKDGKKVEYFWILPFTETAHRFSGTISNTPRYVKTVKANQIIQFSKEEIVDWMYIDGRMKGNFTSCAILKREPKRHAEDFKQQFGLECDD